MEQNYEEMLELEPYSLEKEKKQELLSRRLISLSRQHYKTCDAYKRIVDAFGIDLKQITSYDELP